MLGWLLGDGRLEPELVQALDAEGRVLVEEGLRGSVRYDHFRAPGKRFNGKVTAERMGFGISRERVVLYCRGGKVKLLDTRFDDPPAGHLSPAVDDKGRVAIRIDYDRMGEPKVAGQITLRFDSPDAERIVGELRARLPEPPGLSAASSRP